ncbi:MAG: hypothetical protein WCP20_10240 [Desulfuromonadales bacterium]
MIENNSQKHDQNSPSLLERYEGKIEIQLSLNKKRTINLCYLDWNHSSRSEWACKMRDVTRLKFTVGSDILMGEHQKGCVSQWDGSTATYKSYECLYE